MYCLIAFSVFMRDCFPVFVFVLLAACLHLLYACGWLAERLHVCM